MKKIIFIVFLLLILSGIIIIKSDKKISKAPQVNKLNVISSFYPLSYLAERVGGNYVYVRTLSPAGVEPHDFEPSTRDIAQIENQDVVLLNGGGLEGYADKIVGKIDTNKTSVVLVANNFISIPNDPHVWLDPVIYLKEAILIRDTFIQKDPIHKTQYEKNADILIGELQQLDSSIKIALTKCAKNNIITSHNAFSYFVKRYGIQQTTLTGLSPEEEPSAYTLAQVSSFAKQNKIDYIFFEELVSPSIAETIANEVGAQTLVLSPIEGLSKDNQESGKTYFSLQRENVTNLQIALGCRR